MKPTALLTVPYRTETGDDGHTVRAPGIPAGWAFEQEDECLDVAPGGLPVPAYRRDRRRAIVRVSVPMRQVDALVARYVERGRGDLISVSEYATDKAALRERMATDSSRSLRREWRQAQRENTRAIRTAVGVEDARRELADTPRTGLAPSWLLPLVSMVGAYGAARLLGVPVDDLLPLIAVTSGTTLAEDAWSGTSGDDVQGRTADTTDPGGTWATVVGANGMEIGATAGVNNNGASAAADVAAISGLSASLGGQFSETKDCGDRTNNLICTRLDVASHDGYGARYRQERIYRIDAGSLTVIATDATAAGTAAMRLESVGSDHDLFYDAPGAYVDAAETVKITASDSTYSTGRPGFGWIGSSALLMTDWRGGSIGGGGGTAVPVFTYHYARHRR